MRVKRLCALLINSIVLVVRVQRTVFTLAKQRWPKLHGKLWTEYRRVGGSWEPTALLGSWLWDLWTIRQIRFMPLFSARVGKLARWPRVASLYVWLIFFSCKIQSRWLKGALGARVLHNTDKVPVGRKQRFPSCPRLGPAYRSVTNQRDGKRRAKWARICENLWVGTRLDKIRFSTWNSMLAKKGPGA